jgi:hypothetical protein
MIIARTGCLKAAIAVLAVVSILPAAASAQLVLGQYEDEAPLRTWNVFGIQTAASLGRGDTSFTMADGTAAAHSNPALLSNLPGLTISLNGTLYQASLYKFSLVNTGVLSTSGNLTVSPRALDFGGVSLQAGPWAVSLSAALTEIYDRPQAYYEYSPGGNPAYSLDFRQTGFLRQVNLAIARRLSAHLRLGLGFNFVDGELERVTEENFFNPDVAISDHKNQAFSGFYLNGGIAASVSSQLDLAFVFRTPFVKESESTSELRYAAPAGGTDIRIFADSSDSYHLPLILGLGAGYQISPGLHVLADIAYFNWSKYEVELFGEPQSRKFKDTVKAGLGAEYSLAVSLFNSDARLPVRLGLGYDPQPMRTPGSAYTYFSTGAGLHWKMLAVDFGASFGLESGSGDSLATRKLALSFHLRL